MVTGAGEASLTEQWTLVCEQMDAARARYCEAAKPVVQECEARTTQLHHHEIATQHLKAFIAASDEWALTVAAVNEFARKYLQVG